MAKILFEDKVKIKDIPVAEINKFTDANANEIKAVVNGLDDAINNIAPVEYTNITQVYNVVTNEITEVYNVNYINNINRIIRGQVVWTGVDYTFKSVGLVYEINGNIYSSNNEEITNSVPDATLPRLDVIYVSSAGLGIKEGIPATTPTEPSLDSPESQVKTNLILVTNGETTPIGISRDAVYKENLQETGGEWDTATNNPTAINLASTFNPITGIYNIRATSPVSKNSNITFSNSTSINIVDFNNLTLDIKNLQTDWETDYLEVRLYDSGLYVGSSRIDKNQIDMRNSTTAQEVVLLKDNFSFVIDSIPDEGSDKFNIIEFRFSSISTPTKIQIQIDNFFVQYGDITTTPNPVVLQDLQSVTDVGNTTTNFIEVISGSVGSGLDENNAYVYSNGDGIALNNSADIVSLWYSQSLGQLKVMALPNTADEEIFFPNKSGTIALLSDVSGAEPSQITITTAVSITTDTTSGGYGQSGKNTIIDNGVNAINLTVNGGVDFVASYLKHGTGAITFVQGAGRTLIQVDATAVLDGAVGSTATISSVGTIDYLRISNV